MTSIGSINGMFASGAVGSEATGARQAAADTIGEIGHRVLAWVGASGGSDNSASWSATTGTNSDFRPDTRELARGGDVYGLGDIGSSLAAQFGATPAQQGALQRSLEGFTREAVIQVAGLSGAGGDRQVAGIRDALAVASGGSAPDGMDGVIERLDAATATLARQNGH